MLFQISYSLIRASPTLLTYVCLDFSLHFATFVYTFFLCSFFFYLYPYSFSVCLSIVLNSYSLSFLFTEITPTRFLPSKTFFLLYLYVYFLLFSILLFLINSICLCFFYMTIVLLTFFITSFLSDDFSSLFFS
jgi:hypothetical protein